MDRPKHPTITCTLYVFVLTLRLSYIMTKIHMCLYVSQYCISPDVVSVIKMIVGNVPRRGYRGKEAGGRSSQGATQRALTLTNTNKVVYFTA